MSYPSLEQYQEALQHPETALLDPELRAARVLTSNLGLPIVMCGGFALTYTVTAPGKKYAVRCFHKQSPDLERRYTAISSKLTEIASSYFLPFEFQPQGVRIGGKNHPVVKMAWARGDTLGDFVADNYRDSAALASLRNSLTKLASSLEARQVAHGDLQPGNLMVSAGGTSVQLIDYDGMFVPAIRVLGAAEIGHRNFQHPKRTTQFDATLDRFSLICITVALQALEVEWQLWHETQSDSDSFLFRASDFCDPGSSAIFQKLIGRRETNTQAKALAAISLSEFDKTPTLADFLAGKGIPERQIVVKTKPVAPAKYISQYVVLDARDYAAFFRSVGSLAELVGQITEVKRGFSRNSRGAYVFINFGDWHGNIVKLTVWSAALPKVKDHVTGALAGKWVSVVGLVEPPYVSRKFHYSHISVDITGPNQIKVITQAEAMFRLGAEPGVRRTGADDDTNRAVIDRVRRGTASRSDSAVRMPVGSPPSTNAAILRQMHRVQGTISTSTPPSPQPSATARGPVVTKKSGGIPWWIWVAALLVLLYVLNH
jgi:hypothetical protein